MASLLSKDSYLQSLGKKVCAQQDRDPQKRKKVFTSRDVSEERVQPKKKKKKPRRGKANQERGTQNSNQRLPGSVAQAQSTDKETSSTFSTVDILKKRLHEKIQESRGQVSNKSLTPEEAEKRRQRRKQERERKKRKRKEIKKASQILEDNEASGVKQNTETNSEKKEKDQTQLVFNKVEVHNEPLNKVMQKKEKKERVKGNLTPLTGRNYKQLLSRLELRKNKLEALKDNDPEKAKEFESKMKWTNVLYKAEGVKIKDDEGMLKTALKRKEKQKEQRKKRWAKRTEQTAERMQNRQDKRHRNIQKKKMAKLDKKKNRARKKGRVLPEDLAKAKLK
ncbi:surfeit locus protein 6 [Rhinophrynus dorsalis]